MVNIREFPKWRSLHGNICQTWTHFATSRILGRVSTAEAMIFIWQWRKQHRPIRERREEKERK
jgi:hypothetical protein